MAVLAVKVIPLVRSFCLFCEKNGGLVLADPEVVARYALFGNFTACVSDLKNYAVLTGLGAPVAAPLA